MNVVIVEPFEDGAMLHIGHMLANALSSRGHRVQLLASEGNEINELSRSYELDCVFRLERKDRNLKGAVGPKANLKLMFRRLDLGVRFVLQYGRVMASLARRRPDVVVVSTVFRYPLMGLLLRIPRWRRVRLVQLCHEFELREESPALLDRIMRRINGQVYRQFDRIIMMSRYQLDRFVASRPEVDPAALTTVPLANGAIFREFRRDGAVGSYLASVGAKSSERGYLLFFGRLRPDKGVEDLIEAYRLVLAGSDEPDRVPPLLLCGHARDAFRRDIVRRAGGVDDGRIMIGGDYVPSDAVWDLVSRAGVVILPYRSASQSAALQVAMTCGVPVVATSVGGLPEVVQDGRNGRLVPPEDPSHLADAISGILTQPDLATSLATDAAEDAAIAYAWDEFAAGFERAVEPVLPRRLC